MTCGITLIKQTYQLENRASTKNFGMDVLKVVGMYTVVKFSLITRGKQVRLEVDQTINTEQLCHQIHATAARTVKRSLLWRHLGN